MIGSKKEIGTVVAKVMSEYPDLSSRSFVLTKKHLAILLSVVLTALSVSFPPMVSAQTTTAGAEKVRSKVQSLSVSRDKKVEVKLRDNTTYKGYITAIEPDSFSLSDAKSTTPQKFSYSEVEEVKKVGGGISTKTWIIIGSVAAGSIITWIIVKPAFCDGGAAHGGICGP